MFRFFSTVVIVSRRIRLGFLLLLDVIDVVFILLAGGGVLRCGVALLVCIRRRKSLMERHWRIHCGAFKVCSVAKG